MPTEGIKKGKVAEASLQESYEAIGQQAEQEEPLPEAKSRGSSKYSKGRNLLSLLNTYLRININQTIPIAA